MSIFTGSGVAIVTPFKEDKSVDYVAFKRLIEFQIKNNTDAIIVCGTTGETCTLTKEEHINVVKFCVENVAHRIPVIAGAGSNNTAHTLSLCSEFENIGLDGLLIVTPYYNKTTQKGLINYYTTIAKNTKLPIILYNVPSRTGLNIEVDTVIELSKIDNIVGIKDASGNISQVINIASLCDDDFYIYSGNDDQILPILSIGGKGVISVFANIAPKQTHDIIDKFMQGDFETSKKLQLQYISIINSLFCEVSPIPVKTALDIMGHTKCVFREPLIDIDKDNYNLIKQMLEKHNLI